MGSLSRVKCVCRSLLTWAPVVCFRGMLPNQGPICNGSWAGDKTAWRWGWRCWSKAEEKLSNHSSASKAASAEQHGSAWPLLRHRQVALQAALQAVSWCSRRCCEVAPVRSSVESAGCQSGVELLHVALLLPAVMVPKAAPNPFSRSAFSGYIYAAGEHSGGRHDQLPWCYHRISGREERFINCAVVLGTSAGSSPSRVGAGGLSPPDAVFTLIPAFQLNNGSF